jgi:hypothetical protein
MKKHARPGANTVRGADVKLQKKVEDLEDVVATLKSQNCKLESELDKWKGKCGRIEADLKEAFRRKLQKENAEWLKKDEAWREKDRQWRERLVKCDTAWREKWREREEIYKKSLRNRRDSSAGDGKSGNHNGKSGNQNGKSGRSGSGSRKTGTANAKGSNLNTNANNRTADVASDAAMTDGDGTLTDGMSMTDGGNLSGGAGLLTDDVGSAMVVTPTPPVDVGSAMPGGAMSGGADAGNKDESGRSGERLSGIGEDRVNSIIMI